LNRKKFVAGLFLLLAYLANAQSRLGQCAIKRSEALAGVINMKKDTDSLAGQRLAVIDRDWQDCVVGAPMPSFTLSMIPSGVLDSKALKGKIILINFWFTTCAPCIAEMPGLNKLASEYKGSNVVFVGFTFENRDKIETVFLPSHPFDFRIVPDAGEMEKLFGIDDYPSTFIVDASGRIRKAWSGGPNGPTAKDEIYQKIKPVLDGLLAEKKEISFLGK
jgi:thiol-disulfide isomerase/thioredoxin